MSSAQRADEITLEVAGRLLMVTAERVRQLIKAGYIERTRPGYTTIPSAVQGYIRFLKDEDRKNTKTAADSRVRDARAKEIELRVAREERELIPLDEATLAMDLLVGVVNKELDGAPARITRDMALRRVIEADLHGAKTRIADALAESKGYARTGRDPSEAFAED